VQTTVLTEVYGPALERARQQGEQLASVARTIVHREAVRLRDGDPVPNTRVRLRPRSQDRSRFRFHAPREQYAADRTVLRDHGKTISALLDEELARYAQTGVI
jgi:hypothetical protein